MKLPEDKAERRKLFIATGVIACAVAYVIGTYVVKPMQVNVKTMRDEISDLDEKIRKADNIVKAVRAQEAGDSKVVAEILEETFEQRGLISPILDNYLLAAKDRLLPRVAAAGVAVEDGMLQPMSVRSVSPRSRSTPNAFGAYGVVCNLRESYATMISALASIYEDGRYVCVPTLSIQADPSLPETHTISFVVEWPAWNDGPTEAKFRKIQQERTSEEDSSNPAPIESGDAE